LDLFACEASKSGAAPLGRRRLAGGRSDPL